MMEDEANERTEDSADIAKNGRWINRRATRRSRSAEKAFEHLRLWDRRPDESSFAYAAFVVYRDFGNKRSVDKAYKHVKGSLPPRGRANGSWQIWCAKYNWVERAKAWDDHLQSIVDVQREAAMKDAADRLEDARKKHVNTEHRLAFELGCRLLEFLKRPIYKTEMVQQPDGTTIEQEMTLGEEPSFSNVAQLLRAFSHVGRVGLNMNTVDEDEADPARFKEIFYRTKGQMATQVPDGALPPMPVDASAKPNLNLSDEQLAEAGLIDPAKVNGNGRGAGKGPKLRPETDPS